MKKLNFNFKSIVKRKTRWLLTIFAILTLGVGQMWAWTDIWLMSDVTSWSNRDCQLSNPTDGENYVDVYIATNQCFKFWVYASESYNRVVGPSSDQYSMSINTGNSHFTNTNWSNAAKYTGNNGIVRFNAKQTGDGNGDANPWVWLERPQVVIKHDFVDGDSWEQENMTDNSDGTYTYKGRYDGPGSGANVGTKQFLKYIGSPTINNGGSNIDAGTTCFFDFNANGFKGNVGSETQNTGSLTITKAVTVSFNLKGHGSAIDAQEIRWNTTASTPSDPSATGYTFGGWYTDNSCTTPYNWSSAVTADRVLYAKWTEKSYSITFRNDGHGSVAVDGSTIANGSTATIYYWTTKTLEATNNTGYHFSSWTKSGTYTGNVTIGNSSNASTTIRTTATGATVTANFAPDTYTASGNLKKTTGGTDGTYTATYDASSIVINTAPTKIGYHVDGYYKSYTSSPSDTWTTLVASANGALEGDVTDITTGTAWKATSSQNLYTKWAPNTYTIKFDKNLNGLTTYVGAVSGTTADKAATYDVAANLTSNGYSREGYDFVGWNTSADTTGTSYTDGQSVSNLTSTNGGTFTLYAKWKSKNYTVNFDCNNGSGTIYSYTIAMGATYGSGTEALALAGELPSPSKYGYHFVGWYTLPTGGTEITKDSVMRTAGEHTIYAHFEEKTYVYFYNNLGWTNVFVTYDAYWDAGNLGSGNNGRIYHQMTLVDGTTNIYRDEVPSSVLKSWKYFICFNDTKMLTGGMDVPTESGNYNNYNGGNAVYRRDFDSYATMFVPYQAKGDGDVHNTTTYWSTKWWEDKSGDDVIDYRHQKGYWMKYNSDRTGYAGYVIKGEWDGEQNDYYFKREKDTTVYTVTKYMDAGQTYKFRIYKHCTTTNTYSSWFTYNRGGSAITSAACTNLELSANIAKSETSVKDKFTTKIAGDYTFELKCDPNGTLKLSIKYPERTNDYFRVVYTWNDGSNHTRIYKTFKRIANGGDTWFEAFVHKSSAVNSRSLKLQRYSTSTSAWEDVEGKTFDLSECTKNGLYSFVMTRSSLDVITLRYVGPYTGTIYLRSDVTAGGWDYYNYASYGSSIMTYSDFSKRQAQNPYSHFYCVYVDNDKTNVAFTIATSNTPSICDTLVGDLTIGAAAGGTPNYKALPTGHPANIRFMYNDSLNTISRAYLKSAQGDGNKRFLVLHGDSKMFDSNGDAIPANATRELAANELEFTDKGNWVYEINLKAAPVARAKVIARYNGTTSAADRYLIGGSGDTDADWKTILGGDVSATQYALAGTYDFKTNRLMLAWTPDGTPITATLSDVDMVWVRCADTAATQITFNGGSLTDINAVGAIRFRYDNLVGRVSSWNPTTRKYLKYFVSFPFDVSVSNIFGLNEAEYGREYVIQKYNGAKRAEDGYFIADGSNFWENLTLDSVMHANEGYCVIMDNDYLNYATGEYGNIWKNKTAGSSVYLYFPANEKIDITGTAGKTTTAASHQSTRDKAYTSGGHSYNMKETDSHWNLVGAPYFSNAAVASGPSSYYKWHSDNTWKPWLFSGEKTSDYEGVSNNFNAMSSFMVQYAGTITWNATAPAAVAARRTNADEKNNLVALQILQGEEQADRAFIELKDGAGTGFVLCEDMIKIFNNGRPNLYVHASEYATSYSQVPVESQTISFGVDIWYSGVYTFDMPSNFNGTVTLIDKYAQTRTNLALEDYEVYLDPGVIKDRFELEIDIDNAPTAIDGASDGQGTLKDGKAHKFIMNDQMYILKDGVIYDARGSRVK